MIQIIDALPAPDVAAGSQPDPGDILLSKAFWPWDDLGAQLVPEEWLYMGRKVQGTIAMLSVQTPSGPKLVRADPSGQLLTSPQTIPLASSLPNFGSNVVAGQGQQVSVNVNLPPWTTTLHLVTGPLGVVGTVTVVGASSGKQYFSTGNTSQDLTARVDPTIDTQLTVTFAGGGQAGLGITYWLTAVGHQQLVGIDSALNIVNAKANASNPTYDATATTPGNQAIGAVASISIAAAGAGIKNVAAAISGSLLATAAVNSGKHLLLRDGATGVGAVIHDWVLGVLGVGSADHVEETSLALAGSPNTAMTLEFDSALANAVQSCFLGVYQRAA